MFKKKRSILDVWQGSVYVPEVYNFRKAPGKNFERAPSLKTAPK